MSHLNLSLRTGKLYFDSRVFDAVLKNRPQVSFPESMVLDSRPWFFSIGCEGTSRNLKMKAVSSREMITNYYTILHRITPIICYTRLCVLFETCCIRRIFYRLLHTKIWIFLSSSSIPIHQYPELPPSVKNMRTSPHPSIFKSIHSIW